MRIHRNAKTTPAARAAIVHRALEEGWTNAATAAAFAVSERTVAKWVQRYRAGGRQQPPVHALRSHHTAIGSWQRRASHLVREHRHL